MPSKALGLSHLNGTYSSKAPPWELYLYTQNYSIFNNSHHVNSKHCKTTSMCLLHSKGLPTVTRVQWWAPWFGTSQDEWETKTTKQNKGVCHIVALPFYITKYLKAKEELLWKLKYFHHAKIYIIFQKSFKVSS
jgi:hypothetical protein